MKLTCPSPTTETIHAGCVVWNEAGILIRGVSGIGKSTLARQILFEAEKNHVFGALVCDDRTILTCLNNRLIAKPVPCLAGKLEIRGYGIIDLPFEKAAIIHLVVDIVKKNELPRVAYPEDSTFCLLSVPIPHVIVTLDGGAISAISSCLQRFQSRSRFA